MPIRKVKPDFIVNNSTTGSQINSFSVRLSDGRYAAAFETSPDGGLIKIAGRIVDAAGNPVGDDFAIAADPTPVVGEESSVSLLAMAAMGNGGFAALYRQSEPLAPGGIVQADDLFVQIISKDGAKLSNLKLDQEGDFEDLGLFGANLVTLADGRILAVWDENRQNIDGATDVIKGRIISANGNSLGSPLTFDSSPHLFNDPLLRPDVTNPRAAALTGGGFTVMWTKGFSTSARLITQTFDSAGNEVGAELDVSGLLDTLNPVGVIAALSNGKSIVVWKDKGTAEPMQARFINADGTPVGAAFQLLPADDTQSIFDTRIVSLGDGRFLMNYNKTVQDSTGNFVDKLFIRFFDNSGQVASDEIALGESFMHRDDPITPSVLDGGKIVFNYDAFRDVPAGPSSFGDIASVIFDADIFDGTANADLFKGGARSEVLRGFGGNDTLNGRSGNDKIDGGANNDTITGDNGNDTLIGGSGNDGMRGGAGNDDMQGGTGDDTLRGDDGADTIEGGAGRDKVIGGDGVDTASYENSDTSVSVALDRSINAAFQAGDAKGDTYSSIENLIGSSLRTDTLIGNAVANRIEGLGGADTLVGREGNDTLIGGIGADKLNGGAGRDRYLYQLRNEGNDTIQQFDSGDVLAFDGSAFGGLAKGALSATRFAANASGTAADTNDRFVFNTSTNTLFFDSNGSAEGGSVKIATFSFEYTMNAGDILIV